MRRLIVALLTFAILLGMTLSSVFATDLQNNSTEKEELYYTDLFYAYPYYLERDTYFQEYTAVVGGLYDTVHTAYQNSPLLMETGMEYALRNITSPTEITKLITDTLGLTDFSYNDALDAANNAVVVELLSETSAGTLEKSYGKTCKWVGNIQKLTSYFNKLEQESETGQIQYTAEYYTQVAFDYLWDNGYLSMISDTTLSQLWLEINNSDFQLDDYFTLAKTEVEIAEALVIALMMEDIRLEIINDILVTQSNDTVLKQGMTRLKNKLQKNVVSYFISEYIVNKLADDLFGEIDSFVLDAIGGTQIASLFKIAHKVFTVVYDAPSVENVLMWQVLFCYSQDLSGAISEASQSFDDGPLFSDKILSYENLFAGYDAINKATVKTTKEIAEKLDPYIKVYSILDGAVTNGDEIVLIQIGNSETTVPATTSRQEMFNILLEKTKEVFENDLISDLKEPVIKVSNSTSTVKLQIHQDVFAIAMRDAVGSVRETIDFYDSRYKEVNIFEEHINSVKETIISTPLAERITIEKSTYSNWTYNVTSKISIKQQSDIVENSCIYAVNGHIQGNITFTCDFSIPKEQIHYIDGNVKVAAYKTLTIPQGEQITIDGNVKVSYDGATLCNEGTLTITGDLEIDRAGVVRNKGNLTVCETFIHSLYDGEFYNEAVFQTKNVKAPKLVFSATEDALFCVSGDVSGSVDLNGAPQCAIPGTVVFNGSDQQCVRGLSAEVLTIDNCSVGGVVFESAVSVNTLFNHRGNKFVLKKGGSFVDYDGDGLKDNVDPHPTIAESCLDGHSFGDWLITVEPTPSTSGEREKACSRCNTVLTEELPQICQLSFKGASLSLQHNLAINYKVDKALFEDVGYTDPYVVFELNGVKTKVHSYTIAGDRYIFTFRNIAPNQMNDTIYATLYATYNGVEYASATREYSVAEYCYSMLELYSAAEYAELRTLLVDLLHYGAASQTYTGYRTDALVNASLTAAQLQWGTSEEPALDTALDTAYKTVENPTAKWKGAGLHLQESVAMRLRFTAESIDGLSVKIESGESTWTISSDKFLEEDGVYYVYFTGLDAGQMRQSVYLTIYDGDTPVSNTVCYSIGSYAYEKQNSTIAGLPELVKAMMKYGDSAYAYVH